MERSIILSDLNSFYASVECLHNPNLREKPIAVCGAVEDRHGIVLAASIPAKRFGVRTGDAVWQAVQKCPELIPIEPHMERYVAISRDVGGIYHEFSPQVEAFGLDESYIDLTGTEHIHGPPKIAADAIRRRIKQECGITASVGVSFTRSFAKLASDMRKPDATTVITREDYRARVWPLPVSELLMVGRATAKKLVSFGIRTIGQLAQTEPDFLKERLGVNGLLIRDFANGEDTGPVGATGWRPEIKSVGNSTTTPRSLTRESEIRLIVTLLSESVAERMREKGFLCKTVQAWLRYDDMASFAYQAPMPFPSRTARQISQQALGLILAHRRPDVPIRSVGVRATQLFFDAAPQFSLFPEEIEDERQERIESAIQHIRKRFGHFSIERGVMLADKRLSDLDTQNEASSQSVAFYRGEM